LEESALSLVSRTVNNGRLRVYRILLGAGALALLSGSGLLGMVLPETGEARLPSSHSTNRFSSRSSSIQKISSAAVKPRRSSRPDFRPDWSRQKGISALVKSPNVSVLSDPDYEVPDAPDEIAEWLELNDRNHARLGTEMHEQWSQRMQKLEMRERHHLAGQNEELEMANSNRQMGRTFLRSLLATHLRDGLKSAEKNSDPVRAVSKASEKLDFIANTGVNVEVAPEVKFGSRADIIRQRGRLWMNSPWLNGAVDFQVGGDAENAVAGMPVRNERYRVSFDRSLPFELQSGVVFGATSQTMTTSLSRPLAPNLSCTVENRQSLLESAAEQTARFNYQLRF
jgi:hypothetical protein